MALQFLDGCEDWLAADQLQKYDAWNGVTRVAKISGRFGAGVQYGASGGGGFARKNLAASVKKIAGFALRVSALEDNSTDPIFAFMEGATNHVELRFEAAGKLRVTRNGTVLASGTTVIVASQWWYIELMADIHSTTGAFTLRINGVTEVSGTNVNTRNGGTGTIDTAHWALGGLADGGHTTWFDDIYVLDATTAPNDDFMGDVKVETLYPNGAGNYTQFTPSTGSNWQNVDETTSNEDTDYNSSSTPGQRDSFAMSNLATTAGVVKGIQQSTRWRKDDAGSREAKQFLRVGGTDYDEAVASGLNVSYSTKRRTLDVNPNTTAAWTITNINDLEAGYKIES